MSPVIPPSLIEAARSGEVRGANLAVYIELHEWLDDSEFRTFAAWKVAERLRMSIQQVYDATTALRRLGYVERGERDGVSHRFRLVIGNTAAQNT